MKPIRRRYRLIPAAWAASLFVCVGSGQAATTVTLNPVADTYADEDNANSNYSGSSDLRVGLAIGFMTRRRSYVRFNLSSIPSDAIVSNAQLRLYLNGGSGKTNFAAVDGRDVLARLATVPVETWNYKGEAPVIRHIGPMAQDFSAAFSVGEDDRHINPIDANGVAFAAIQGLHQLMQERDAEIAALKARLAALERRIGER